jgi:hypothetical protein
VRLVREVERTFARGCERGDFRLVHYSLQGITHTWRRLGLLDPDDVPGRPALARG